METTLNNQAKKLTLVLGIIAAILIGTTLPASADHNSIPSGINGWENSTISNEDYTLLKEYVEKLDKVQVQEHKIIIYDQDDNLQVVCSVNPENMDSQIKSIIERSDLIMDYNGESYYKIN